MSLSLRESGDSTLSLHRGSPDFSRPAIGSRFSHHVKRTGTTKRRNEDTNDIYEHEMTPLTKADIFNYPRPSGTFHSPESKHQKSTFKQAHHKKEQEIASHKPVPATIVFARDAPPVHFPKLDTYLAQLPSPPFASSDADPGVFPPMEKLNGTTVEDLENNSVVAPSWRNPKSLLSAAVNVALGLTGSSALATYYSLQGLSNTVQIFALIISTIASVGNNLEDEWRKLLLGTIPNILALNFPSTVIQSLIFLLIFMGITSWLLYYFYQMSGLSDRYSRIEGLQQADPDGKRWGLVFVTFALTIFYLPLSTLAVHVLVWSEDLWIVPNPYVNATSNPPILQPLGPVEEYRDPLDFCWTTTMKRNEINFAPVIFVLSFILVLGLTIWFPIALHRVIQRSVPKVDPYTELGKRRNRFELDAEYQRLLSRDQNPFAFVYSQLRRGRGDYQSTYLFAKFSTLLIVAVFDTNNCLFRSSGRWVSILRQILLLSSTIIFFLGQCLLTPFIDPVSNASEWTSRLNYVTTSATALLVVLDIPGKDILNDYVLYVIYITTYGLGFYFTIINLEFMRRWVKKLARRIDFSIDIFSPRIDISPSSPHIIRRIWQESITTILLTSPDCKIPSGQRMAFAQARDSDFPPYLLDFRGTPGERHVENIKIHRDVGPAAYSRAVALTSGPDQEWFWQLEPFIRRNHIGPDSYWRPPGATLSVGYFFGNAWWIPFPPTLVIRYDDGRYATLQELPALQEYVKQNSSKPIRQRRWLRMCLRALEGKIVIWPYEHAATPGWGINALCGKRKYTAQTVVHFENCLLRIKRRGHLLWSGLALGSGYNVELVYAKNVHVNGSVIGLNDDYDLTMPLARFLSLNKSVIARHLPGLEVAIADYRDHQIRESGWKVSILSYEFHLKVYNQPSRHSAMVQSCSRIEHDSRLRDLLVHNQAAMNTAYSRFLHVSSSAASSWWYLFWDDFWRRNHTTIPALTLHAQFFNPHYPSSIAYTPIPRTVLVNSLVQRGVLSQPSSRKDTLHSGLLNKLYVRLNEIVFHDSVWGIKFHLGRQSTELDMDGIDLETMAGSSTFIGTGGGTDHDNVSIIARPVYHWEGLLNDHVRSGRRSGTVLDNLSTWLGLTPLWRVESPSEGLSLDLKLCDGKFVLMEQDVET